MTTTGLTFDEFFNEDLQSPFYKGIRNILVRNYITDVDRLRTVSIEQLARLGWQFTHGPIKKLNERLRFLTGHGLGSDSSNYGWQRCLGVYGRVDQMTPLAMAQLHSGWLPQPLLTLILAYAPDTRMRHLEDWDEFELCELLDLIVAQSPGYPPMETLYHEKFLKQFIGALTKWDIRFTNRRYVPSYPAFAVA